MGRVKEFVAYGAGYSGDFDTFEEAQAIVSQNGQGAVFIRQRRSTKRDTGILKEVFVERERQDDKWGGADHDDQHTVTVWRDLIHKRLDRIPTELFADRQHFIEIAALAVAAVQSIDRKVDALGEQVGAATAAPAEQSDAAEWRVCSKCGNKREVAAATFLCRYCFGTESFPVAAAPVGATHYKPNWLWCGRCQAWIETAHQCGAQYIDKGTHFELVKPAAPVAATGDDEGKDPLGVTPEIAAKLIHLRDTIAKMESSELVNEAWHTLYSIADPEIVSFFPWTELERLAALRTPVEGTEK